MSDYGCNYDDPESLIMAVLDNGPLGATVFKELTAAGYRIVKTATTPADRDDPQGMGAPLKGQALAVPATPANAVDGRSGFDPSRVFTDFVGRLIDHPSLYMGGPSRDATRKAADILRWLSTSEGRDALEAAIAMDARQGRDAKQGSVEDDSAAIAQPQSED